MKINLLKNHASLETFYFDKFTQPIWSIYSISIKPKAKNEGPCLKRDTEFTAIRSNGILLKGEYKTCATHLPTYFLFYYLLKEYNKQRTF